MTAYPSQGNTTGNDLTDATLIAHASSRYPISRARRCSSGGLCSSAIKAAISVAVAITITATTAFHASPAKPMRRQAATSSPSAVIITALTTITRNSPRTLSTLPTNPTCHYATPKYQHPQNRQFGSPTTRPLIPPSPVLSPHHPILHGLMQLVVASVLTRRVGLAVRSLVMEM